MMEVSDQEFDKLISEAIDQLPEKYIKGLNNVLITYEDEPSQEQRQKLKLACHQSLFGLYEGIPRTERGNNYNLVLPDKITLFKLPLLAHSYGMDDFKARIKHTLWHEIAHYYGLNHDEIHDRERRALDK